MYHQRERTSTRETSKDSASSVHQLLCFVFLNSSHQHQQLGRPQVQTIFHLEVYCFFFVFFPGSAELEGLPVFCIRPASISRIHPAALLWTCSRATSAATSINDSSSSIGPPVSFVTAKGLLILSSVRCQVFRPTLRKLHWHQGQQWPMSQLWIHCFWFWKSSNNGKHHRCPDEAQSPFSASVQSGGASDASGP